MIWIGDRGPHPIPPDLLDRVMYRGTPTTGRDYARIPVTVDGPQAHLAIQGAATAPLPTHFHGVEQFQLFVAGSGTVGRHEVRAGIVHYTDRNTVYGPLRPGPEGMSYATLRARHDPGASFMPGAQDELADRRRLAPGAPHRNVAVRLDDDDHDAHGGDVVEVLAADDGLRIAVLTGDPPAPTTVGGAGAYLAVVAGTMDTEEGTFGPGAITWLEPGEHAAAAAGCRLALLQFPLASLQAA